MTNLSTRSLTLLLSDVCSPSSAKQSELRKKHAEQNSQTSDSVKAVQAKPVQAKPAPKAIEAKVDLEAKPTATQPFAVPTNYLQPTTQMAHQPFGSF